MLTSSTQAARDELAEAKAQSSPGAHNGAAAAQRAADELAAARSRAAALEVELAKERARLQSIKGAEKVKKEGSAGWRKESMLGC